MICGTRLEWPLEEQFHVLIYNIFHPVEPNCLQPTKEKKKKNLFFLHFFSLISLSLCLSLNCKRSWARTVTFLGSFMFNVAERGVNVKQIIMERGIFPLYKRDLEKGKAPVLDWRHREHPCNNLERFLCRLLTMPCVRAHMRGTCSQKDYVLSGKFYQDSTKSTLSFRHQAPI